jgi:hypothetical protein
MVLGALVACAPAFAIDPIFKDDMAQAAFLRSFYGRAIVRHVIADAQGAPDRLNRQHYRSFLVALDYKQNILLTEKLNHHLTIIFQAVYDERAKHGGEAPKNPVEQAKELKILTDAAEEEFDDPNLLDLAEIAPFPDVPTATTSMRTTIQEGIAAMDAPEHIASAENLPEGTEDVDLYPSNPKLRRAIFTHAHLARSLVPVVWRDLRDMRNGVIPVPQGMTVEESRVYRENFYFNVRRFVSLWGGFNDYARDSFAFEIFSHVKRPAYAALNLASADVLRQYAQGEISIEKLIEARKKIAVDLNLDIPEITFYAERRILHVIARLKRLTGEPNGAQGQIAEATANLKSEQARVDKLTKEAEGLRVEIAALKRESDSAIKLRQKQQTLVAREAQIALAKNEAHALVDTLAQYYMEIVETAPRVDLFNSLRQGYMVMGPLKVRVGTLDMPDIYTVSKAMVDHVTVFEHYGLGRIIKSPTDPTVDLPDMSARVIPLLVRNETRILRSVILTLGRTNREFANDMDRLCREACGCPISAKRSMAHLAEYVEAANAKIVFLRKVGGIATFVGGTGIAGRHQIVEFVGWCHQAFEPVLKHIGL